MKWLMFLNLSLISFCLCVFRLVSCDLDLQEGSSCEWEGAQGKCVLARQCVSFVIERTRGNYSLFPGKYPPICSFEDKEPIVCCVACSNLGTNAKDILDNKLFKTGRKYEEQCLIYQYLLPYECSKYSAATPRLSLSGKFDERRKCYDYIKFPSFGVFTGAGGVDVKRGDFPHMALLGYGENPETVQWLCGGSLISDRHILTAAHCGAHTQLGPVSYVALGVLKRSDPEHYWKRYRVKVFYPHEGYKSPHKYHDIAIIETETTVNLTDGVRPACLTHKQEFIGDEEAYATGWGSLGPRLANADVMQKVFLTKFSAEECASQYPPHRHLLNGYNHTTQICYGDHNLVRDTCEGDSGGPLQKRDPEASYCPYAIIGVTSSGHACGSPGQAGLYTRVSHYLPWIESIVWPD